MCALLARVPARVVHRLGREVEEAQITAALESPHSVELYDFGIAEHLGVRARTNHECVNGSTP